MTRTVLVVGAHADDIEINTGGLLSKYVARGYRVVYVMATNNMSGHVATLLPDGTLRHDTESPRAMMARRKRECDDAVRLLGGDVTVVHLDHPQRHYRTDDGRTIDLNYGSPTPDGVDMAPPTIITAYEHADSRNRLARLLLQHEPECVFTHGVSENNIEHMATSLLVTRAVWEAVADGFAGSLLHWRRGRDFLGASNCTWDTHIDITDQLERKIALIAQHRSQLPMAHRPDFEYRRLAQQWGQACHCDAAEVFYWVRRGPGGQDDDAITSELLRHTTNHDAAAPALAIR
jgi:LmbE family N-acetylglucosaminyl deacetylase